MLTGRTSLSRSIGRSPMMPYHWGGLGSGSIIGEDRSLCIPNVAGPDNSRPFPEPSISSAGPCRPIFVCHVDSARNDCLFSGRSLHDLCGNSSGSGVKRRPRERWITDASTYGRVTVEAETASGVLKSAIRVNRFGWAGGGKLFRAGYDRRSGRVLRSMCNKGRMYPYVHFLSNTL